MGRKYVGITICLYQYSYCVEFTKKERLDWCCGDKAKYSSPRKDFRFIFTSDEVNTTIGGTDCKLLWLTP